MFPSSGMDTNITASSHSGIPYSEDNEHTLATHHNVDGSHQRTAEWKKQDERTRSVSLWQY